MVLCLPHVLVASSSSLLNISCSCMKTKHCLVFILFYLWFWYLHPYVNSLLYGYLWFLCMLSVPYFAYDCCKMHAFDVTGLSMILKIFAGRFGPISYMMVTFNKLFDCYAGLMRVYICSSHWIWYYPRNCIPWLDFLPFEMEVGYWPGIFEDYMLLLRIKVLRKKILVHLV